MNVPYLEAIVARGLVLAAAVGMGLPTTPAQQAPSAPATQSEPSTLPDAPAAQGQPAPKPASSPTARKPSQTTSSTDAGRLTTVLEDTALILQTVTPLNSSTSQDGDPLTFLVSQDVRVDEAVAIPRGATVHGVVLKSKKAGALSGAPELTLKLTSLDLGGRTYTLYSHLFRITGTSKTRSSIAKVTGGASVGAAATGIAYEQNGGTSNTGLLAAMGKGAAVGAGAGTAVAVATPGPKIEIPTEAEVEFSLAAPISVIPVSAEKAARLAEGLNPGGPSLYVRGETP